MHCPQRSAHYVRLLCFLHVLLIPGAQMQRSHLRAQVLGGACPPPSDICSVVCPWSGRPYAEQLSAKREKLEELMSAVSKEVGAQPVRRIWCKQQGTALLPVLRMSSSFL